MQVVGNDPSLTTLMSQNYSGLARKMILVSNKKYVGLDACSFFFCYIVFMTVVSSLTYPFEADWKSVGNAKNSIKQN